MAYQVWIDQDLCTGDGLCIDLVDEVFAWGDPKQEHDQYLAYVHKDGKQYSMLDTVPVPDDLIEDVVEAIDLCPGECIFIEPISD